MSLLDQLKKCSIVVADTADFGLLAKYKPQDATTNPSLVLAGSQLKQYSGLIDEALRYGKANGKTLAEQVDAAVDHLTVSFGVEILKIVPGRVSTEVDAKLSYDAAASVAKALKLVAMYKQRGIGIDRLYIKLASTWEGIQAARVLEAKGIQCNLTLLFSFAQAVACAQAGVSLISPFVGRILDWHKKTTPKADLAGAKDPGVVSVTSIFNYYKVYGYKTIVMGASFRNVDEIIELAGCDKITISPNLLEELATQQGSLAVKLNAKAPGKAEAKLKELSQADFLFLHNEDAMGVEKLAEGIRNFNKDTLKLHAAIALKLKGTSKL